MTQQDIIKSSFQNIKSDWDDAANMICSKWVIHWPSVPSNFTLESIASLTFDSSQITKEPYDKLDLLPINIIFQLRWGIENNEEVYTLEFDPDSPMKFAFYSKSNGMLLPDGFTKIDENSCKFKRSIVNGTDKNSIVNLMNFLYDIIFHDVNKKYYIGNLSKLLDDFRQHITDQYIK